MKTISDIKQACRYSYQYYTDFDLNTILKLNPWLFNQAYTFLSFYDNNITLPKNVFRENQSWVTENCVLFSGANDNIESYEGRINWDDFGTWYIYLFPAPLKLNETMLIGKNVFLERKTGNNLEDYFKLNKAWQFIHEAQPDIFISKQKKGVLIGALSEINIMCIETK